MACLAQELEIPTLAQELEIPKGDWSLSKPFLPWQFIRREKQLVISTMLPWCKSFQ
jgi:hypothetical protein